MHRVNKHISDCYGRGKRGWHCEMPAAKTHRTSDVDLTIIWVGSSCRLRKNAEREALPTRHTVITGKVTTGLHDRRKKTRKNRIWSASTTSLTLPFTTPQPCSFSLSHSLLRSPSTSPSLSLTVKKKAQEAAEGGEMVLALKARFTWTHASGRLSPRSVSQNGQGCLSPPRHSSQKLLASGERQRRDRASGKRQCTQLLRRGRGNLGWRVRGRKRGEGVEVRVVCMCICGSVSIVVGTSPPPLFQGVNGDCRSSCCPLSALCDVHSVATLLGTPS